MLVAGNKTGNASLTAYACRNVTTGATMHAGTWGSVVAAVILPLFGLFFCGIASLMFGRWAAVLYLGFLAGAVYFACRALRTSQVRGLVRSP